MTANFGPAKETLRLAKLQGYNVLDTLSEAVYDDITSLAAHICQTPTALMSLVDAERQWFKSRVGLGVEANETPRGIAFCNQTIRQSDLLVVEDASVDERFQSNPLVTGEPYIRFYAGAPLITPDGHALGSLCVIDYQPRQLSAPQLQGLRVLSRQVVAQLELRLQALQLQMSNENLEKRVSDRTAGLTSALHRLLKAQTKLLKREASLRHSALHDPLTGLPNRSYFSQRLGQAIQLTNRQPEHLYAVLFIDLDNFKQVNDTLGHGVGDRLLKHVADQIKLLLRKSDLVARLGGDEFAVLLDDIPDEEHVIVVVERLQSQLATPFRVGSHELLISASVGITFSTQGYQQPEAAIRDADVAMYRAKQASKQASRVHMQAQLEQQAPQQKASGNVAGSLNSPIFIQPELPVVSQRFAVFDTAVKKDSQRRLALEMALQKALTEDQFHLYYQPIFDLKTAQISGFEVLLRWHHPERGCLRADDFFEIAEEIGIIRKLGDRIINTTCQQLQRWRSRFSNADLRMHLNLSPQQIQSPQLISQWKKALSDYDLVPAAFYLEIDEQILLSSNADTMSTLKAIRALDLRLCVDDFGRGHSSLSRLHQLAVSALKIDRTFVNNMMCPSGTEIVKTIVDLGRSANMVVVAEGIETQAQLDNVSSG